MMQSKDGDKLTQLAQGFDPEAAKKAGPMGKLIELLISAASELFWLYGLEHITGKTEEERRALFMKLAAIHTANSAMIEFLGFTPDDLIATLKEAKRKQAEKKQVPPMA